MEKELNLTVNGKCYELTVEPNTLLLDIIRNDLGLTGTKKGCSSNSCGVCTVLVDDKPVLACSILAVVADGKEITTVEGLAEDGKLHPLQDAFIEYGAVQCGFCTPGMLLTAKALLDENPAPTENDVRQYLKGNLCRCTGYAKIIEAILGAAKEIGRRRTI